MRFYLFIDGAGDKHQAIEILFSSINSFFHKDGYKQVFGMQLCCELFLASTAKTYFRKLGVCSVHVSPL